MELVNHTEVEAALAITVSFKLSIPSGNLSAKREITERIGFCGCQVFVSTEKSRCSYGAVVYEGKIRYTSRDLIFKAGPGKCKFPEFMGDLARIKLSAIYCLFSCALDRRMDVFINDPRPCIDK